MPVGPETTLYIALSGSAVLLLFAVVIWLRLQLTAAERQLDLASRQLARKNSGTPPPSEPLLDNAPFPACYMDMQGKIVRSSSHFRKLSEQSETGTEFTKATGATLPKATKPHNQQCIVRGKDGHLHHFILVAWPVQGTHEQLGTMYVFLEQTRALQAREHRDIFQRELLALQSQILSHSDSESAEWHELKRMTEFLQEHSGSAERARNTSFDLARVSHGVIADHRSLLRQRDIAVTAILPKSSRVLGDPSETSEVLEIILSAVAEHAPSRSTIRLHVGLENTETILYLTLPEMHLYGHPEDIFGFGKAGERREAKLRLALARMLMTRQHGKLVVREDDGDGAVVELRFHTAPKRKPL